ncbi:hypothetical protein D9M71_584660 [compost metagenome]
MPYQVLGESAGAVAVMISCRRRAILPSAGGICPIFSMMSASPSAFSLPALASAFSSLARSFMAARSSAVNPSVLDMAASVRTAKGWLRLYTALARMKRVNASRHRRALTAAAYPAERRVQGRTR